METPIAFVIEDQMHLATLYEDALRLVGFDVVTIMNGLDAINQLELASKPPSLILLDVNMPKVSGREVYAHIQKSEKLTAVPVVIATANSVVAAEMQHDIRQQDQLLVKPIGMRDLQNIAKKIQDDLRGESADTEDNKGAGLTQDSLAQAVSRSIQSAKVDTAPPTQPEAQPQSEAEAGDTNATNAEVTDTATTDEAETDDTTVTIETDGVIHSEADTQEAESVERAVEETQPAHMPTKNSADVAVSGKQSDDISHDN